MTQVEEIRQSLRELKASVDKIEAALIGNEGMGYRGLVDRMASAEVKIEQHDRKLLVWGSILAASGAVLVFLKDFFFGPKP